MLAILSMVFIWVFIALFTLVSVGFGAYLVWDSLGRDLVKGMNENVDSIIWVFPIACAIYYATVLS